MAKAKAGKKGKGGKGKAKKGSYRDAARNVGRGGRGSGRGPGSDG